RRTGRGGHRRRRPADPIGSGRDVRRIRPAGPDGGRQEGRGRRADPDPRARHRRRLRRQGGRPRRRPGLPEGRRRGVMRMDLQPVALSNRFVRLEPFSEAARADVGAALDCDPGAWDVMVTPAYGAHFETWWTSAMTAMQAGNRIPYA